jgi:predicted PurR-regulated permease PerM
MMKLALITLTVVSVVIGALALWEMREAVQLLALSLALAAALTPDVQRMARRGLPLTKAVSLSFAVMLLVVIVTLVALAFLAYAELASAIADVPAWYESTRTELLARTGWLGRIGSLFPSTTTLTSSLAQDSSQLGSLLYGVATSAVTLGVLIFSVASLAFYWLLDRARLERLWLSMLPLGARVPARALWEQIYREVGIFVRGEAAILLLTVIALLSAYEIAGLPGPVTLALVGGLAQVLPLIGPPVALVPALAAAATQGPTTVGYTLALGVLVLSIIKLVVAPRVFRKGLNINPVLLVVVIMVLAGAGGVVSILLGPPVTAAIQVAARVLFSERQQAAPITAGAVESQHVEALQQQIAAIELRADLAGEPQVQALLTRARRIVAESSRALDSTERAASS